MRVRAWALPMLLSGMVMLMVVASLIASALSSANSIGADSARDPVKVKIIGHGRLLESGAWLEAHVKVRCDPVGRLQEALITVSQDGGLISGDGFFGGIVCDGRARTHSVRANPDYDEPFHSGRAYVSAYVLLYDDESGEDFSGGDTRTIPIH